VGRDSGVPEEKLLEVADYATSGHYDERERVALEYADRITITSEDVDDELFERLKSFYSPEEIVELTFTVAYENFLSKFSHPLRIESQGFCPVRVPMQTSF
jgi:alkylhydroperoxidase family enzyme